MSTLRDLVRGTGHHCGRETTLREAAQAMAAEDHGSLGIIDGRQLVGLITERDLLRAVARGDDLDSVTVGSVMASDPDVFPPDLDTTDAAAWLVQSGYRHLPVMDEGELLGVVSIKDVLGAVVGR